MNECQKELLIDAYYTSMSSLNSAGAGLYSGSSTSLLKFQHKRRHFSNLLHTNWKVLTLFSIKQKFSKILYLILYLKWRKYFSFGLNPAPPNSPYHSKVFFVTRTKNLSDEATHKSSSLFEQLSVILILIHWGHWSATQD